MDCHTQARDLQVPQNHLISHVQVKQGSYLLIRAVTDLLLLLKKHSRDVTPLESLLVCERIGKSLLKRT